MSVQRFVKWCETANTQQRATGAAALARAWADGHILAEDRPAGLVALNHLLDDPSPKVRLALARAFAHSNEAPRRIMLGLAEDIDDVACLVVAASPVLLCSDLVDLFAYGSAQLRLSIVLRRTISGKLSAAIVEVGDREAVAGLLANPGADVAPQTLRRAAERLGDEAEVRGGLLDRHDLPIEVRQLLLLEVGQALSRMALLRCTVGERRIDKLILESCETATANIAADVRSSEIPALVEHLRITGQLSTAFLIRVVCSGHVDLFTASLVALCGLSERRVRAIVVEGREGPFDALVRNCGLPPAAGPLLRTAIRMWKTAVTQDLHGDLDELPAIVMSRLAAVFHERQDEPGFEAVLALLRRLETETIRRSARSCVEQMAA
ncbi:MULTISPECIES: DUF2336 domain-containing protein [unclassified Aureimonas]|uniref:DUF2336 domain-containing protein n=1 Tax=unclassified Aureimonas TaxID=2615206 RepID=UPI0006F3766A|nr:MULTISPECIES: DUF2336 domain-containing protein [unclassified Aureimonas]KQT77213.1 hypothetical protein ASG54_13355 [Aureimonas sp. Leaf460]